LYYRDKKVVSVFVRFRAPLQQALATEDREERNKRIVLSFVMGNMNLIARCEFQRQTLGSAFIMSDFNLDVDSPLLNLQEELTEDLTLRYPQKIFLNTVSTETISSRRSMLRSAGRMEIKKKMDYF
jgi:hypothetical protein